MILLTHPTFLLYRRWETSPKGPSTIPRTSPKAGSYSYPAHIDRESENLSKPVPTSQDPTKDQAVISLDPK